MIQSRVLMYGNEARVILKKGVDALANMVKVTLGPKGRNVVIDRHYGGPLVTKDGVTVAKEIHLKDGIENIGAQLVKEVASKTADVAGDGTTTATVLAQAIIGEGLRSLDVGVNAIELKRGIDVSVKAVVEELQSLSQPVEKSEDVVHVGTVSANNDIEIGKLIAGAMEKVGKEGIITVEDAKGLDTYFELSDGMQFDRGYLSMYFITNPVTMEAILRDCYILVTTERVSAIKPLIPILEHLSQNGKPLLIIGDEIEGLALNTLVINKMQGKIQACAVKAPGFGDRRKDILQDIAILTQATLICAETGRALESVTLQDLGFASKIVVTRENTTIIGGAGAKEEIIKRADQIKAQLETTTSDYDKEKLQERLARLLGGIGILYIGAATEIELKEKKMRIEDALHATRAAVEEGIVPGGGIALIRAREALMYDSFELSNKDQEIGRDIIYKALLKPFYTIVENAGKSGDVVLDKILNPVNDLSKDTNPSDSEGYGYNALTDTYEDLTKSGVVDPTKVVRCALENAASVAGLFLTTEGIVAESLEEKKSREDMLDREPMQ
ncbi:MAG: chaperonin GroEL [Methanogenium sp.]|jgi:chaperonin GroEL